jgi:hypothetical protein
LAGLIVFDRAAWHVAVGDLGRSGLRCFTARSGSLLLDAAVADDYTSAVMRVVFARCTRLLSITSLAVLLVLMASCGTSSIVGKWRMVGAEDQTVWEFSSNGSVLIGDIRGRYKFGDQDRIKIETPFATTVYQVTISSDQLVLQEPGGSKLQFTRVREGVR